MVIIKPNPLVKIFTDLIYYQAFPAADVPAHLQTEVTALLATYPADPYLDEHRHLMSHVDGLVAALAAKETPDGAQAKANAVLALAKTFTTEQLAALVQQAPATLDTLNELAAALGDDPNFATTVANQIGTKVDKITGKGLSTNDYTTAEKTKLGGVAAGANNYVHPATHAASMITGLSTVATSGSYNDLLGKPTIPAAVTLNDTVTSTSTTQAATARAVKEAYDNANASLNKSGGTMTGALVAQSNTSYTVRQVHNMILSDLDANLAAMQNGDIWIKYK